MNPNCTMQIGYRMTKIQSSLLLILAVVVTACDTAVNKGDVVAQDETSIDVPKSKDGEGQSTNSIEEHETVTISSSSEIDTEDDIDSINDSIKDTESEAVLDSDTDTLLNSELGELDSNTESTVDDSDGEIAADTESSQLDSDTEGGNETGVDIGTASSSNTESTDETVATETLPTDIYDTFTDDTNTETDTDSDTGEMVSKLRICLSPGHPSSEGDKLYEAIINRKVAFYLEELLLQAGYDVLIAVEDISKVEIFETDFDNEGEWEQSLLVSVSLDDRVDICNNFDADYFISLHHNAFEDPTPNYTMTLYAEATDGVPYSGDTVEWAELTTESLTEVMSVTGGYTRGDRSFLGFGLKVLQETSMPAIMTEASFYTNPSERLLLNQNDYLEGEAGAIFDGFDDFQQMQ